MTGLANRNRKAVNNPGLSICPILVKLEDMTVDELSYSICCFITEVRHADKAEYPPATLKIIGAHVAAVSTELSRFI